MDVLNEPDQEQRIETLRRKLQELHGDTPLFDSLPEEFDTADFEEQILRQMLEYETSEPMTPFILLEKVVPLALGNLIRRPPVFLLLRHPDAAIVAQRLAHQCEFGLIVTCDRNAGGMYLREAGICKSSASLVSAPNRCGITVLGVGREIKNISVAAGCQNYGVSDEGLDLPRD